ncbi:MAG: hypothetical protein HQ472_07095, partial [Ignavibacteria bacterium]|nr:hypothetical protein [Ignavibacteria bacterium]
MKFYIVFFSLLFSVFCAHCQIYNVYSQRVLGEPKVLAANLRSLVKSDTTTYRLAGFMQKRGYLFIDPVDRSVVFDSSYLSAGDMDVVYFTPYLNGFIALAHSSRNDHSLYDSDSGFRPLTVPDSLQEFVAYGMSIYPGNYIVSSDRPVISPDLGETWYRWPDSIEIGEHDLNGFSTPIFRSRITNQSFIGYVSGGQFTLEKIPIKSANSALFTGKLGADSIVFFTRDIPPRLRMGRKGETTFKEIVNFDLGDSVIPFRPNQLLNLASGAVLYLDESGRAARIKDGTLSVYPQEFPVGKAWKNELRGHRRCEVRGLMGITSICTYHLTDPPTYEMKTFNSTLRLAGFTDLGTTGIVANSNEPFSLLHFFPQNEVLVVGSLLRDFEYLRKRRMLFSVEGAGDYPVILTDNDQLIEVKEAIGFALLAQIRGENSEYVTELRGNPDWLYPTEGISMVVVNDSTLMFPGGVLRTISVTGQTIDTLYKGYVSSVSRLDDGTFVSADRG